MSKHALLSASSAERWLHCTPSARLEAELPDTGELCPYYADPERPGQIYVYQSCWDEGTGTTYMAYVRYEAETTN